MLTEGSWSFEEAEEYALEHIGHRISEPDFLSLVGGLHSRDKVWMIWNTACNRTQLR